MTILEKAVSDLADALDELETKVAACLDDQNQSEERAGEARRHAQSARTYAQEASSGVADAIAKIKNLLESDRKGPKG